MAPTDQPSPPLTLRQFPISLAPTVSATTAPGSATTASGRATTTSGAATTASGRLARVSAWLAPALIVAALTSDALAQAPPQTRVKTENGVVEGTERGGVRSFKGIPFGAPPVGDLRWKEPQPVANWTGVRPATAFGTRCMQLPIYGDMAFRASGTGEDCLYLNVWAPAGADTAHLPVLVYFYGGGFAAGDGSEPRYDGENMAKKGIVALTVNYRLGVFGFFAHPELTKESAHHASGNYAILDQTAALRWVQRNIAAFGGDPKRVTIAGESAGSISVSLLMASPLSKGLMAAAIGESGASIAPTLPASPLADAEQTGVKFATAISTPTLAALRAMPAQQLLEAAAKPGTGRFPIAIDGYVLPKSMADIFAAGEQAHVPLLVGWNSEEMSARSLLHNDPPTAENYAKAVRGAYPERADDVLKLYNGTTEEEIQQAATDLSTDRFIAFSTWKWFDLQKSTGGKPVYLYFYARPRPAMTPKMGNATAGLAGGVVAGNGGAATRPPPARGAVHSAEIEYAMGNLATNTVFAWTPDDHKVSELMHAYFANFVKTGDPNGAGLPAWPVNTPGPDTPSMRLRIDVDTHAEPLPHRDRYQLFDQLFGKRTN
jgi:para-nitrobenzyl esterase